MSKRKYEFKTFYDPGISFNFGSSYVSVEPSRQKLRIVCHDGYKDFNYPQREITLTLQIINLGSDCIIMEHKLFSGSPKQAQEFLSWHGLS